MDINRLEKKKMKNKLPGGRELTEKELKKLEIFKVQIPVSTNAPARSERCLIYNEDRSIEEMLPIRGLLRYFKKGVYKRYMYGFVDDQGVLQLFDLPRLKEQNW